MKLFSTKKFAELADVSVITLKRWRKSGKLSPVLIDGNGKIFYSEKQLEGVTTLGQKFSQGCQLSKICLDLPISGVTTFFQGANFAKKFANFRRLFFFKLSSTKKLTTKKCLVIILVLNPITRQHLHIFTGLAQKYIRFFSDM